MQEGRRLVPSEDVSGHGTAVLGVAAGSDFSRGAVNRGVAYESDLLVVKWEFQDRILFQELQS
ncbi:MAG: hypothetical protein ACLTER_26395 [Ruminococcus sp.]